MIREPGVVMTEEDAAEHLRSLNRYKTQYSLIENNLKQGQQFVEQQYVQNLSNLSRDNSLNRFNIGNEFIENISNAFDTANNNKFALMRSDIGTGFLGDAKSDIERGITAAYDSYINNYMSQQQSLNEQLKSGQEQLVSQRLSEIGSLQQNAQQAINEIDNLLYNEATNWAGLINAPKEYLQYLVDNQVLGDNHVFDKYLRTTYRDGTAVTGLMTDKEWDAMMFETDAQGNKIPTREYKEFIDLVRSGTSDIEGLDSFDAWFNSTNPELYDFYRAYGNEVFKDLDSSVSTNNQPSQSFEGETFTDSKDFGTIRRFGSTEGANRIDVFDSLKLSGLNTGDVGDKTEDFSATYVDDTGTKRKYKLRVNEDAEIADDSILNDIQRRTGSIDDGKLYAYGEKLYLASNVEDSVQLIEVEFRDGGDAFWSTLNNQTELNKTGTPINYNPSKTTGGKKREGTYKHKYTRQDLTGTKSGKW